MSTKKNVTVNEKIEEPETKNEEKESAPVDEKFHDFIDDYTYDECVKELGYLEDWFNERRKALKNRMAEIMKERYHEKAVASIKNMRDILIEAGISAEKADDFVLTKLDTRTLYFNDNRC